MKGPIALPTLTLLLLTVASAPAPRVAAQRPQVPAIRTGITMVPVDVRVLDRDGRPVTDLKREDFTILEDGVRQRIEHFSASGLTPQEPAPGARPQFRKAGAEETTPQNQRIFLIVLGRGRLQQPTKAMDALVKLVRERLLPQDQVAVLAFNRASDFTTDREKVAGLLERFKKANNALETKLASHFSGLQARYGSRDIPARIQEDIDAVFSDEKTPGFRSLPPGTVIDRAQIREDVRRDADNLQRAETIAGRTSGLTSIAENTDFIEVSFDQYVFESSQTGSDLSSIYSGIEYLRHLQGEKHLLFVSERGLYLPRTENDYSIAAVASDARVVMDTIHTGGLANPPSPFSNSPTRPLGRSPQQAAPLFTFRDRNAAQSLANVSQLTGGIASRFTYADNAMRRIDDATRFQYLLAYAPSNTEWNGRFRRIVVRVNRPGLTVLYRHGYYGRDQLIPFDRQQFMTYSRIVSAGNYSGVMKDLPLDLKVAPPADPKAPGELQLELTVDVSRVKFTPEDDRQAGALEIAFFCGDGRENVVGELWQRVDLRLPEARYQRALKEGFTHTAKVPVDVMPNYVKAIVYDPNGDVLGSTVVTLKK
jgi:VWFA-related protein